MKTLTRGEKSFLQWLQKTQPQFYALVMQKRRQGQLGAAVPPPTAATPVGVSEPGFLDRISDLVSEHYEFELQKQTIDHQIQVAQQNQLVDQYYGYNQNVPQIQIPGFRINQTTALFGIAGLFGLWYLVRQK